MGSYVTAPNLSRPSGELGLGTNQLNIVSGTPTTVLIDTIAAGFADGIEDTGNNRITPGVPGWYLIVGRIRWSSVPAATNLVAMVRRNGSTVVVQNQNENSVGGSGLPVQCSKVIKVAQVSDYFELRGLQNSGVNTPDIDGQEEETFLAVQRVR